MVWVQDTLVIGRAGKVLRLVRVMRILRVFKVSFNQIIFKHKLYLSFLQLVRHFNGLQSLLSTLRQVLCIVSTVVCCTVCSGLQGVRPSHGSGVGLRPHLLKVSVLTLLAWIRSFVPNLL